MKNKDLERAKQLAEEIYAQLGHPIYLGSDGGFVMFNGNEVQPLPATEVLGRLEAAQRPVRELLDLLHNTTPRRVTSRERET